ncbi:MAG: EndoU domain-containing protein [Acidobacteriota bacterium]
MKLAIKGGDIAATTAGIVEDAKTLVSPDATAGERALAAASLLSEVVSPVSVRDAKSGIRAADAFGDGVSASRFSDHIDLISPKARTHILDGDRRGRGGGHRFGTGRPGKTEFPETWSDDQIIESVVDVATSPHSRRSKGRFGRTVTDGEVDGVAIRVVQEADGTIVTGYPTNLPRNPKE